MKKNALLGLFISGLVCLSLRVSMASTKDPCEKELEDYCSTVKPGEGRLVKCLDRYKDSLSDKCKDFIKESGHALKEMETACGDDTFEYCRDVKPSYRRIAHCLQQYYSEVSSDCRMMLKKRYPTVDSAGPKPD